MTTKEDIMRYWTADYTCCCGLYVHPANPLFNSAAIHIADCQFAPAALEPNPPTYLQAEVQS